MLRQCHVSSQLNEDCLHVVVSFPVGQARKLGRVNLSSPSIDTGQIDFGQELQDWWLVRIAVVAMYLNTVDSVLVYALTCGVSDWNEPAKVQQLT